jgi:hypothetical protein
MTTMTTSTRKTTKTWIRSYTTTVKGIDVDRIWQIWSDVDAWHTWQPDLDFAKLEGGFTAGSSFTLKPKGGPRVRIALLEVEPKRRFVDLTRFPLARMYGTHEFIARGDELEIRTSVRVEGALGFLWRGLVAEGVAKSLPEQTRGLIARARAS